MNNLKKALYMYLITQIAFKSTPNGFRSYKILITQKIINMVLIKKKKSMI